jgi:hypothetical protein
MNASNWMKRFAAIAGSALMGLMFATGANAANPEPVPVEVEWVAPVAIVENATMSFGWLATGTPASETVTMNTDDTYSESAAGTVIGGTQTAAQVTITVANTTPITILVDSIGSGTYYTLGAFMCSYATAPDEICDSEYDVTSSATSSSSGDIIEIGATLTVQGTPAVGTDDTTFDVTVTYQ